MPVRSRARDALTGLVRTPARLAATALLASLYTGCSGDPRSAARDYLASGDRYARQGRDAAAAIEYRNAVRLVPTSSEALDRLAATLTRLERLDEAAHVRDAADRTVDNRPLPEDAAALADIVVAHPRHVGARLALAQRLIEAGDPAAAEKHLRAALDVDPGREIGNRALAALLLASARAGEAELYLRRAAAARPQRYHSQLALADYLIQEQRWSEVPAALDAAAASAPDLREAVAVRRIAVRDATGFPADARRELAALIDASPGAEAWALAATFAWRDGDRVRAESAARQALALDPQQAAASRIVEAARWQAVRPEPPSPPSPPSRPAAARRDRPRR